MNLSNKIMSDITVYTKYAKYIPELKRRETGNELVTRNKEMHLRKFKGNKEIEDAINGAYEYVYAKKVVPSMRSLQFGGKPIEISPNRVFNCAFTPANHVDVFSEIMFLLLGGSGVGFSVQKHHVEELPEIRKPNPDRKRRYLIGDSIEGWADAIKVLVKSYFGQNVSTPEFDFSDIRPKGSKLITSGGKAPGPQPLKECILKISGILSDKQNGDKLKPIEVHDIICHIADAVLAGGIRRAALISLFSADDYDMLAAKTGKWYEKNPQRGRANNSVVLLRHRVDEAKFFEIWDRVKGSGCGEPGIIFTNDKDWGVNPCAEIALRPNQFCVAGDTKLITKNGITTIRESVGKEIEIGNGKEWSLTKPYQTGDSDRLHRVWFSDGSYLDATDNHKFLVKNRFQKEYSEVETIDLIDLLKTSPYSVHIPRSNINYDGGSEIDHAYDLGFVLGDGTVHPKYNRITANLFGEDKKLRFETAQEEGDYSNYRGTKFTSIKFNLNTEFCRELKYNEGLPSILFSANKKSVLKFIAGGADADGTNASKGIRIYGREDKIRDAQLLLTKFGINSSVNLMSPKGNSTNLCARKNDVWYLQITKTFEIPSQRLLCDNKDDCLYKGKYQTVKRIDTLDGRHESFCLTEEKRHQCVFNNVLTKQCNLTEMNVSDIETQEDLENRARAAAILGTLQATYTDFHYLREIWKRNTEKDMLLGVSMTGIGSGKTKKFDVKAAAKVVVETNKEIAKILGIKPAARCTTIKPSGTSSLVLSTSSGIHAWHDNYYIRRMRVGKNESIYQYLSLYHPELVEDEEFRPHDTAVISIPQKAPEGSILRTESALSLLRRVKGFHDNWISPGHITGQNMHNISATISIKEHEWYEVGRGMGENRNSYNGLSVLPFSDHTYVQAPFESIEEATYEKLMESLKDVDLTKVIEDDDNTDLSGELACSSGACELV